MIPESPWPPRPIGWTAKTEEQFAGVLTGHALIVKELRRIADANERTAAAFEKIAESYVNIARWVEALSKLVLKQEKEERRGFCELGVHFLEGCECGREGPLEKEEP